jgi:hypothetical protein
VGRRAARPRARQVPQGVGDVIRMARSAHPSHRRRLTVEVPEAEGSRGSLSQARRRNTGAGRSRTAHGNDDGGEAAALPSRAECRLADRDECENETDSVHRKEIFKTWRFPRSPRSVPALANQRTGTSIATCRNGMVEGQPWVSGNGRAAEVHGADRSLRPDHDGPRDHPCRPGRASG